MKTGREQGKGSFAFLEVNDGSCPANLQVIVDAGVEELSTLVQTGTCVSVEGVLKVPPEGAKQKIELRVERVLHVGPTDPAKYPIPKTKLSLEFLRDHVHLRPRTNTVVLAYLLIIVCVIESRQYLFRKHRHIVCICFNIFFHYVVDKCFFVDFCSCSNSQCTCFCHALFLSRAWFFIRSHPNHHHK